MSEDGRRTAPMTMRDEPASGPAEAGGLDKLNGGRMLQEQLKRVRQRVSCTEMADHQTIQTTDPYTVIYGYPVTSTGTQKYLVILRSAALRL